MGRVRMKRLGDASAGSMEGFVKAVVRQGSLVHTDGYLGYLNLGMAGYDHQPVVLRGRGKTAATELLPRVHLVVALLKRWLCSAPIKAPPASTTSTITWTSSPSASIAGVRAIVVCSSGVCSRTRFVLTRFPTRRSWAGPARLDYLAELGSSGSPPPE